MFSWLQCHCIENNVTNFVSHTKLEIDTMLGNKTFTGTNRLGFYVLVICQLQLDIAIFSDSLSTFFFGSTSSYQIRSYNYRMEASTLLEIQMEDVQASNHMPVAKHYSPSFVSSSPVDT